MSLDLSWETFAESFISPAIPAVHAIRGSGDLRLFVDGGATRIGLWLRLAAALDTVCRSGKAVSVRVFSTADGHFLEVATAVPTLYQQFFSLAEDIVSRVHHGAEPIAATEEAIRAWRELLRDRACFSLEEQIGLWGELWVLGWLVGMRVDDPVASWIGPLGEPHDFRFGGLELEAKTHLGVHRHHAISSLHQLVSSRACRLSILSLLLAPAPEGLTLPAMVDKVRRLLTSSGAEQFEHLIERAGYIPDDASSYRDSFVLRADPVLVPVDEACPIIRPADLLSLLGPARAARVLDARYVVDLEGLGRPLVCLEDLRD